MNARELGIICALLSAMPNLVGCESSRSQDYQFEKQVKRAQECRQLQSKLVGDQPLTPERAEEIAKTMDRSGCTARLPARWLEPVSKSFEEDNEAGKLDKAEEIVGVVLPANEDPALPLNPSEEALDEPASHVAA
jgi:metal-sulfur cluster biosynthetic enzyme